jgi:hypothetical protein
MSTSFYDLWSLLICVYYHVHIREVSGYIVITIDIAGGVKAWKDITNWMVKRLSICMSPLDMSWQKQQCCGVQAGNCIPVHPLFSLTGSPTKNIKLKAVKTTDIRFHLKRQNKLQSKHVRQCNGKVSKSGSQQLVRQSFIF